MTRKLKPEQIVSFKFIRRSDNSEARWTHWSRQYEYPMVLNWIEKLQPTSIHNTSCGGLDRGDCLHLTFCNEVSKRCTNTIHSDIWGTTGAPEKPDDDRFEFYDITKPYENGQFDMVMNISVLEELPAAQRDLAFDSLYAQLRDGGHMLLTFDYPQVDLKWIEALVGRKINRDSFGRLRRLKKNLSVIELLIKK